MKLKNAKVGLRVQMKATDNHVPVRSVGTVTEVIGDIICVHWVYNVDGWGDKAHGIPSGHGWAVRIKDLRKVKE